VQREIISISHNNNKINNKNKKILFLGILILTNMDNLDVFVHLLIIKVICFSKKLSFHTLNIN
jgi:hypothetical protein